MPSGKESGRMTLMKGALAYLWEEMKTMNRRKFRAMSQMAIGYLRMRLGSGKKRGPLPWPSD